MRVNVMLLLIHPRRGARTLVALACVCAPTFVRAQANAKEMKDPGTIAGRVVAEGHGAAGVPVMLMPQEWSRETKPAAKATTDADGRYRLTDIPPGRYFLSPIAPAFVISGVDTSAWQPGRLLNVAPGDRLEGLDFTLTRGGVITGRVRDADGRPLVEMSLRTMAADESNRNKPQFQLPPFTCMTDDRGVYRIYGLAPGRYLVFFGETPEDGMMRGGNAGVPYPRTFYGNTTEMAQARVVELTTGEEVTGVDITVGKPTRTYEAAGRVVDERGQPVAGLTVAHGPLSPDGRHFVGGFGMDGMRTNERGEFHVRGLLPGRHAVFTARGQVFAEEQNPTYCDPVAFEIVDQDVTGLELKLVRGATITGLVTLEGTSNPAVVARLAELHLGTGVSAQAGLTPPNTPRTQVSADGSFHLTGVPPGRVGFFLTWPQVKGFSLLRVQRDGVEQAEGIEVRAGEQVTGVRIILGYGVAVVRGQVQFPDGAPPAGGHLHIEARRVGAPNGTGAGYADVDTLGRFVLENLSAGEHEFYLFAEYPAYGTSERRAPVDRKVVNVPENGEAQVTLVFKQEPPP